MPPNATPEAAPAPTAGAGGGAGPGLWQGHRGTRAIQRLVEYAPSSGGLALWVAHREAAADAPLVTTDGHTVHYGPAFDTLPLPLQTGHVAHAVLHVALRHAPRYLDLQQRLGDVDLRLFNLCADVIVDSALGHLAWLQLPAHAVQLDRFLSSTLGLTQTIEAALLEWDVERLYRAIDDRRLPATGGQREDGPRSARARAMAGSGHADLQPGAQGQEAPETQAEAAREWAERIVRGHTGDGDLSMLRTLLADLPRAHTPWEQVLRTQLARGLSQRPDLSWSRPSRSYLARQGRCGPGRRMPFEPGVLPSRKVPRLVLVVDVSGSIDDTLLQRFSREIEAITRRLEAGLTLVIGDDRVQRVEHCEPGRCDLSALSFNGGGGTDFTPLLEEAGRHDPDITVVLTDLDGPARHRPRAPVLWAVPEAFAAAQPPFGRLLVLR